MARLISAPAMLGASVAIVCAVAVMPQTSWTFRNHLDLLTGGWERGDGVSLAIVPARAFGPTWTSSEPSRPVMPFPERTEFPDMWAYARQRPQDAAAMAHVVRLAATANWDQPRHRKLQYRSGEMSLGEVTDAAMWAAERGTELEPENAFFWMMRACLLRSCGALEEADRSLARAAECRRWNDHAWEEARARISYLEERHGYRGKSLDLMVHASMLLGHYAHIRSFVERPGPPVYDRSKNVGTNEAPPTPAELARSAKLLRVYELILEQDESRIGLMVAGSGAYAIMRRSTDSRILNWTKVSLTDRGVDFGRRLQSAGVPQASVAERLGRKVDAIMGNYQPFVETHRPFFYWTGFAALMLAALVASLAMPTVGAIGARIPGVLRSKFIAAHFLAFALWQAFITAVASPSAYGAEGRNAVFPLPGVEWLAPVLFILAIAQFIPLLRVPGTALAIALTTVCSAFGVAGWGISAYLLPIAMFLVAPALLKWRTPTCLPAAGAIAVPLFFAVLWTWFAVFDTVQTAALLTIVCAFAIMSARSVVNARAVPAVALCFSLGYLYFVFREIGQDEEAAAYVQTWLTEADSLREKAGLGGT